MIIWFIFFFIVSQIIIEKGQLPTVVYQFGLVRRWFLRQFVLLFP